jgi:hypothetical protein
MDVILLGQLRFRRNIGRSALYRIKAVPAGNINQVGASCRASGEYASRPGTPFAGAFASQGFSQAPGGSRAAP